MEKVVDLFYTRGRFKDKIIALKQVADLLLIELDKENVDTYLVYDYVHQMMGFILIMIRWLKKIRLEELKKEKNKEQLDKELDKYEANK